MADLTEAELSALEELERAATAGPWEKPFEDGALSYGCRSSFSLLALDVDGMAIVANSEDAALIAAMRNVLPSLIAAARERDELRRQVEAIREIIENPPRSLLISVGVLREAIAATESKGEL